MFSIINTEMGVVGILPLIYENYGVTVAAAELLVSMFVIVVAVYAVLFVVGYFTVSMAVLTFIWGILAGVVENINQCWLAKAAPKAYDFAKGIFLSSTNLGTTVCGFFLSAFGTQYIVLEVSCSLCAFLLIVMRVHREKSILKNITASIKYN